MGPSMTILPSGTTTGLGFKPSLEVVPGTPGPGDAWPEPDSAPAQPRGPKFLLPEIRDPVCPNSATVNANIQKAMDSGSNTDKSGSSSDKSGGLGYLEVPFNVPRRRHSWICG